jgi:hypothetical protein
MPSKTRIVILTHVRTGMCSTQNAVLVQCTCGPKTIGGISGRGVRDTAERRGLPGELSPQACSTRTCPFAFSIQVIWVLWTTPEMSLATPAPDLCELVGPWKRVNYPGLEGKSAGGSVFKTDIPVREAYFIRKDLDSLKFFLFLAWVRPRSRYYNHCLRERVGRMIITIQQVREIRAERMAITGCDSSSRSSNLSPSC